MKAKLVLVVCMYVAFFIASPPFQLPDEPDHYQYIFLLSRRFYPRLIPNAATPGNQPLQQVMEKYFTFTRVASRDFAIPDYRLIRSFASQSPLSRTLPVTQPVLSKQGQQPPLYHIAGAAVFAITERLSIDMLTQFYLVRGLSALFYFLSVYLAYRLFRLALHTKTAAENLTVFFAINPLVLKMGMTVNPDIALLFFCLLFLHVAVTAQGEKKAAPPLLLVIITGAAILSKFAGVFLIPFYIGYLFIRGTPKKPLLQSLIIFTTGTLAVVLPWLLFNLKTYGTPVIDNFSLMCRQDLPHYPFVGALIQAAAEFRHAVMHYAGFWGWGEPYPFKPFFLAYAAVFVLAATCGLVVIFRQHRPLFITLTAFFLSLLLFLFPVSLRHKLLRYSCDIQGRYLLPVFPVLSLMALTGIIRLLRLREETVARSLMFFAIFQANLILWYVVIPKYYV